MAAIKNIGDIAAGRLSKAACADNFTDIHPPYDRRQAALEADRCYFCHDAPCMTACPTGIDVPLFIRQIAGGNVTGSAKTILAQNIMGGMCARVCPTETLCEQVCVRNQASEGKPVKIGHLQRFAVDALMQTGNHPFERAKPTGKRVAVVGAGPAGLACAHRLATLGHAAVLYEARGKLGGLNEYGIAAYKSVDDFAQAETRFILSVGGIEVKTGQRLGQDISLGGLRGEYDAVFLGLGMGAVNALGLDGEDLGGAIDAVDFIAQLRQAKDPSKIPVGRRIVVIGGGMTAIDIAVQTKALGAEEVTLVYRRGQAQMKASPYEQELAQTRGVTLRYWAQPSRLIGEDGQLAGVEFERTAPGPKGRAKPTGERFCVAADMAFRAIGQKFVAASVAGGGHSPKLANARIAVDKHRKTSLADVWAGGDCVEGGEDLTVAAVEDGKIAARAIDQFLKGK
ncbi:MAG: NAD(P)-dependent oxidoreductase [Alphaproteobacteria bacterium]